MRSEGQIAVMEVRLVERRSGRWRTGVKLVKRRSGRWRKKVKLLERRSGRLRLDVKLVERISGCWRRRSSCGGSGGRVVGE
jgi:hypothetical protein